MLVGHHNAAENQIMNNYATGISLVDFAAGILMVTGILLVNHFAAGNVLLLVFSLHLCIIHNI